MPILSTCLQHKIWFCKKDLFLCKIHFPPCFILVSPTLSAFTYMPRPKCGSGQRINLCGCQFNALCKYYQSQSEWNNHTPIKSLAHWPWALMFCRMKYRYSPQMPAAFRNSSWVMPHSCWPLMLKWENEIQLASSLYWSQQNCSHSHTLFLVQYSG